MIGTINIKTRPLKMAFLVDPNSKNQVKDAIKLSSSLWGGCYFPIIPLYKVMPRTWKDGPIKAPKAKDVILGYIEAFDPDVLVQLSKDLPSYISDVGIEVINPDEIWDELDENRNVAPRFGLGIFEILNDIFDEYFKYKMKYPVKLIFPKIHGDYDIFWSSWFGEVPDKLWPLLDKYYVRPLDVKKVDANIGNLKELLRGDILFPRRIVDHKIENYRKSGFRDDGYIYYLDASKIADIIDFWNLRAMGKTVLPMPKQLKDNPIMKKFAINFLKDQRIPWRHNPSVCDYGTIIRSRNSTMKEIQDYANTIKIKPKKNDNSDSPYFSLQHWYPRVWNEWARDKDGAVPNDIYGEDKASIDISDTNDLKINLKSILPKFAQKHGYSGEPRCANEVEYRFFGADEFIAEVFPKFSGRNFIRSISGLASFRGDWRIGRNGLVKLVNDNYRETQEIPLSEKVFFAWLEDIGWKPKLSPPGLLAKQIYKILEGYPSMLRNEKLLGLIEHMNGGKVKKDGSPVIDNKITKDRNILVGEVKRRLENDRKQSPYNYLIGKGLFKLGVRIKCPNCNRDSWYPMADIGPSFSCPRCLNKFDSIGNIESSKWAYKTSGPFSVADYAEGAYAVILTLDFFSDMKMNTMMITPVTSFVAESDSGKILEADFAAFWQDSIFGEKKDGVLFGECKTYGLFKDDDFQRMSYLAKTFPGAVLIFSTLRKKLTTGEIKAITSIAKKGRKYWKNDRPINPVLILTGNELLHDSGPPSCWSKEFGNKFDRATGMLNVCDATQQIYLALPSWHTEWHEKWKKKAEKKKLKTTKSNEPKKEK